MKRSREQFEGEVEAVRRFVVALILAVMAAVAGSTAHAQSTTDATFTVTSSGGLSISVPTSTVNLGSVAAGTTTLTASLGTVTVTDTRDQLTNTWTATATGTHFDNQDPNATPASNPDHRVLNTAVSYTATPTVTTGGGTATVTAGTMDLGATVAYTGTGANEVTWNPSLTFTLLATQAAGTYQGTITHSVS